MQTTSCLFLIAAVAVVVCSVVNAATFNAGTDGGSLTLKTKGSKTSPLKTISFTLPSKKKTFSKAYAGKKVVMTVSTPGLVKRMKIDKDIVTPKFKKDGSLRSLTIKTPEADDDSRFLSRELQSLIDCFDCRDVYDEFCDTFVPTSCTETIISEITAENEFVGAVLSFICEGGDVFDCSSDSINVCGPVVDCDCGSKSCPGGFCFGKNSCCAGERKCSNGDCIDDDKCCADEFDCKDSVVCGTADECCPGEANGKCGDGSCAGPSYDTGCFDCPDGNKPVPLDFKDDPIEDACCPNGEFYCDVSQSCISNDIDCCDEGEVFCAEFDRCIADDAVCGIEVLSRDCSETDTIYARCDDLELDCLFACLGVNFVLKESAAFGGLICDEPFGDVEVDNCPEDLSGRRLEILRERGVLA